MHCLKNNARVMTKCYCFLFECYLISKNKNLLSCVRWAQFYYLNLLRFIVFFTVDCPLSIVGFCNKSWDILGFWNTLDYRCIKKSSFFAFLFSSPFQEKFFYFFKSIVKSNSNLFQGTTSKRFSYAPGTRDI